MLGWLQRGGFRAQLRIATLAGMAVAVTACACADRRRGSESAVRAAAAAPAPMVAPIGAAAGPSRAAGCGLPGEPDCPLQAWMDHRFNGALSSGDYPELARSMRELAADRPEPFSTWASWAEQGAAAAERQDDAGIRKACSGCHDDTREAYRQTMRDRPVRSAAILPDDSGP